MSITQQWLLEAFKRLIGYCSYKYEDEGAYKQAMHYHACDVCMKKYPIKAEVK